VKGRVFHLYIPSSTLAGGSVHDTVLLLQPLLLQSAAKSCSREQAVSCIAAVSGNVGSVRIVSPAKGGVFKQWHCVPGEQCH